MRTRLRRLLLPLIAAAVVVALPLAPGHGLVLADGTCMNGTNWDNLRQVCA